MSDLRYMPFEIDAYLGATVELDPLEHSAYLLLLFRLFSQDGWIEYDEKKILAITKMNKRQWKRVEKTVISFFEVQKDQSGVRFLTQKRVSKDIQRIRSRQTKARKAADARWLKNIDSPDKNALGSHVAKHLPSICETDARLSIANHKPLNKDSTESRVDSQSPIPDDKTVKPSTSLLSSPLMQKFKK